MQIAVFGELDRQAFIERLVLSRRRARMTQRKVAGAADVNPTHYNEIERGKQSGIHVATLYKLCQVLHVSSDYLLGLSDVP